MDLTQQNMALVNHLKVCQEQKDHTEQENASLKERIVSMLSSQVRRVEVFSNQESLSRMRHHPFVSNRVALTRTLHCEFQGTFVQRGILHCIYATYMNHMYQSAIDVQLLSHYTLFGSLCTNVHFLSYICITALYCTTPYTF